MPFIRKVRVLFKTRLIFPRINGPNVCLPVQDGYGFLSPWQKTYRRLSRSLSVSVETDGHELTISLVSVDPILFDDFIYLCHLQSVITHDSPEESIESVKAIIQQNSVDH